MKIKKLHKDAILPYYSTDGSSAFDLFCYKKPTWVWSKQEKYWTTIINTGLAFEVPEDYGMFILSRSGHGFRADTTLSNSVGLIDSDFVPYCTLKKSLYTGTCKFFEQRKGKENKCENCEYYYDAEVKIKLICFKNMCPNIDAGQAVAQAVIIHAPKQYFEVVDKLKESEQQHEGFGSTDKEE